MHNLFKKIRKDTLQIWDPNNLTDPSKKTGSDSYTHGLIDLLFMAYSPFSDYLNQKRF